MKAVTSAILNTISGKLGDLAGKHTRRGQQISRKSTPYALSRTARSTEQQAAQQKYADILTAWQALSTETKEAYDEQGTTLKLSGWNIFLKEYMTAEIAKYGTANYGTGKYT